MQDENEETPTNETESKPTITIAEKEREAAAGAAEGRDTITIAEKEDDE